MTRRAARTIAFMVTLSSIILGCSRSVWADSRDFVTTLDSTSADDVSIVNGTNTSLVFGLRINGGDWKEFHLDSGNDETYRCRKCEGDVQWEFSIRTDGNESIRYKLNSGKKYTLRWNERLKSFDLFEAKR